MRLKKELMLHNIGDEYIVMNDGSMEVDFNRLLNLNPTAVYLWQQLEGEDFDEHRIVSLLTERYDVTENQALTDAQDFIRKLQMADVVTNV